MRHLNSQSQPQTTCPGWCEQQHQPTDPHDLAIGSVTPFGWEEQETSQYLFVGVTQHDQQGPLVQLSDDQRTTALLDPAQARGYATLLIRAADTIDAWT